MVLFFVPKSMFNFGMYQNYYFKFSGHFFYIKHSIPKGIPSGT